MHYYSFNIGDYQSHTSHLSEMEDLVYRRMLDWYYLHEKPLPSDYAEIARLIRMRSHIDCIAVVLHEYFDCIEDGWIHHRANKEIAKAGDKSEKASASAKARWNKRDANALPTQSDSNATHNTLPNTQDTKHNVVATRISEDWFLTKAMGEWALTERPDVDVRKQAEQFKDYWLSQPDDKAFRKDWFAVWRHWIRGVHSAKPNPADNIRLTVPASNEPDPALEKIKADAMKAAPMPKHIRAKLAEIRKS